jgi:hypothetical protein
MENLECPTRRYFLKSILGIISWSLTDGRLVEVKLTD